jgi:hypothetical protein
MADLVSPVLLEFARAPLAGPPVALVFGDNGQVAVATGLNSTQFGLASSLKSQVATGSAPSTTFGTPALNLNSTRTATGFQSGTFGTPNAAFTQFPVAIGFSSTIVPIPSIPLLAASIAPTTTFGTHTLQFRVASIGPLANFGTPRLFPYHVPGWLVTRFGVAQLMPTHPVGFRSTAFGTPLGVQYWTAASLGECTHFGTPSTPTNRIQVASGELNTHIGHPTAIRYAPAITLQKELASGFRSALFGTPTAHPATAGAATGFTSSAFGTPAAITWGMVTSLGPTARFGLAGATGGDSHRWGAVGAAPATAFGTPVAKLTGHASTLSRVVSFGTPQHGRTQQASSTWRATRFGTPTCARSNTYIVYGINASGRFGQPRAFNRFNYPASGFTATQLGTPACLQRHRVTMTAPATRFGTALLVRNPECIDRYAASSFGPTVHFGTPSC